MNDPPSRSFQVTLESSASREQRQPELPVRTTLPSLWLHRHGGMAGKSPPSSAPRAHLAAAPAPRSPPGAVPPSEASTGVLFPTFPTLRWPASCCPLMEEIPPGCPAAAGLSLTDSGSTHSNAGTSLASSRSPRWTSGSLQAALKMFNLYEYSHARLLSSFVFL